MDKIQINDRWIDRNEAAIEHLRKSIFEYAVAATYTIYATGDIDLQSAAIEACDESVLRPLIGPFVSQLLKIIDAVEEEDRDRLADLHDGYESLLKEIAPTAVAAAIRKEH
jgi:hypothetical protein